MIQEQDFQGSKITRNSKGQIVERELSDRAIKAFNRKVHPDSKMERKVFEHFKNKYGLLGPAIPKPSKPQMFGFWVVRNVAIKTPIYGHYLQVGWADPDHEAATKAAELMNSSVDFCPFSADGFINGANIEYSDLALRK